MLVQYKAAFEADDFMRPGFYSDQRLRDFFGVNVDVKRRTELSFGSTMIAVQAPLVSSPGPTGAVASPTADASIQALTTKGGVSSAGARISMSPVASSDISYEEVDRLFQLAQADDKRQPPIVPPHPPSLPVPTHPHGNEIAAFDFSTGRERRYLVFRFDPDGKLESVFIELERKASR
jgi:hypothetical protein